MSSTQPTAGIEALLAQRSWVRALARCLVHDDADADDLAQQAWVEAIERPPQHAGALKAWFATVLRRRARDRWREQGRRTQRESAAARPEAVRSSASIVEEAEAHRRVVDAVMELPEPLRETVLLRFFEELPPREVASRMSVPVETVRTRTRRALERLRENLDREHGGQRAAWMAALAPLADWHVRMATAAAADTAAATGGMIMGTKSVVAAGALGALLGALAGGAAVRSASSQTDAGASAAQAQVAQLTARLEALETAKGGSAGRKTAAGERRAPDESSRRLDTLAAEVAALSERGAKLAEKLEQSERTRDIARIENASLSVRAARDTKLADLPTDRLLAAIREMVQVERKGQKIDAAGLVAACELLLARQLEPQARAEGLELKGIGHRALGDRAAEEACFREAQSTVPAGTERYRMATAQLGWTHDHKGDPRTAADTFLQVANDPAAPAMQRSWYRYYAGERFAQAGDRPRARAELRAVLDEYGTTQDRNAQAAVKLSKDAIDRMDREDAK